PNPQEPHEERLAVHRHTDAHRLRSDAVRKTAGADNLKTIRKDSDLHRARDAVVAVGDRVGNHFTHRFDRRARALYALKTLDIGSSPEIAHDEVGGMPNLVVKPARRVDLVNDLLRDRGGRIRHAAD